jgi:hypothetical protein
MITRHISVRVSLQQDCMIRSAWQYMFHLDTFSQYTSSAFWWGRQRNRARNSSFIRRRIRRSSMTTIQLWSRTRLTRPNLPKSELWSRIISIYFPELVVGKNTGLMQEKSHFNRRPSILRNYLFMDNKGGYVDATVADGSDSSSHSRL